MFKTLTVVLLLLVTAFSAFAQSLARVPDGLCLLLDDHGGSGYGVLIGNRIYTAAHVLEHSITAIYVTQGGNLVSVNPNLVGSHRVHSYWMDSSPLSEGFDRQNTDPAITSRVHSHITTPFDVGYIEVNQQLLSDFQLDPSTSFEEVLSLHESLGIANDKWQVARIMIHPEFVYRVSRRDSIVPVNVAIQSLLADVMALGFHYNTERRQLEISGRMPNLWIDQTITSQPGDSGGPIFVALPNGKYLVTGIMTRYGRMGSHVPQLSQRDNNFFPTSMSLISLEQNSISLRGKPLLCGSLL